MEDNAFKTILERLLSFPLKDQIKVDCDLNAKVFRMMVPIFTSEGELPPHIKKYVEARKEAVFKPHATTFSLEGDQKVLLIQEIPFQWGFQPSSFRDQIHEFCKLAKASHRMLMEMALEETYKEALAKDNFDH